MDTLLNNHEDFKSKVTKQFKEILPYFRTIKFKLAFLYSSILFVFAGTLVLGFNVYLGGNLHKDPDPTIVQIFPGGPPAYIFDDFNKLNLDERQRIRNIRLNDLRRVQQMSLLALLPLAAMSFAAGYYLSGQFLDPLSRLKLNIEKLESKDLGIKFDLDTDDEVGALIQSFNDLSLRLQTAFQSQERFVQDASHELRTPLTIIQTNLDTVLDNPTATKEEMHNAVTQALGGVRHLRKLVNYLLELTTAANREFVPVNIQNILSEQIANVSASALDNGTPIQFKKSEKNTCLVQGDELLIGRVFLNLLENAIKYSFKEVGKKSPIVVSLKLTKKEVLVTIQNLSEAISKEDMEKLFDRFYQVDPSRSKKLGGYGLGLSIVKKIVEEHKGTISALSENGTVTLTVRIPRVK